MENSGEFFAKQFNALPEEEQRRILAEQAAMREYKKPSLEDLTNADIALLPAFGEFCAEQKIEPTKRQASKQREAFIQWHSKKYPEQEV